MPRGTSHQRMHLPSNQDTSIQVSSANSAQLTQAELSHELKVLTKAGDVEGIQNLAANPPPNVKVGNGVVTPAILLAAEGGSLQIVKVLTDWSKCGPGDVAFGDTACYSAVMKGRNPELLVWFLETLLISRFDKFTSYGWLGKAVATGSPDMYAAWEDFLLDIDLGLKVAYPCYTEDPDAILNDGEKKKRQLPVYRKWYIQSSMKEHHSRSVLFSKSAFEATKGNALLEARLIQTWHKLINNVLGGRPLDKRYLGYALVCLAQSTNPSINMGEELLRLGAPIDFPTGQSSESEEEEMESYVFVESGGGRQHRQKRLKGMTALHHAARKKTEQASRFVRFLLEQGANPEYVYQYQKPVNEPGAALMKKWLGETWEEVVERTKEARWGKEQLVRLNHGDACDDDDDGNNSEEAVEDEDDEGEAESEGDQGEARSAKRKAGRDRKRRKLVRG